MHSTSTSEKAAHPSRCFALYFSMNFLHIHIDSHICADKLVEEQQAADEAAKSLASIRQPRCNYCFLTILDALFCINHIESLYSTDPYMPARAEHALLMIRRLKSWLTVSHTVTIFKDSFKGRSRIMPGCDVHMRMVSYPKGRQNTFSKRVKDGVCTAVAVAMLIRLPQNFDVRQNHACVSYD
jgi:hypothetical protein